MAVTPLVTAGTLLILTPERVFRSLTEHDGHSKCGGAEETELLSDREREGRGEKKYNESN